MFRIAADIVIFFGLIEKLPILATLQPPFRNQTSKILLLV